MFILKKGHQPGVYVSLRALFLVFVWIFFILVMTCWLSGERSLPFGLLVYISLCSHTENYSKYFDVFTSRLSGERLLPFLATCYILCSQLETDFLLDYLFKIRYRLILCYLGGKGVIS